MSFWRPSTGTNIIVGSGGLPIDCAECPCDETIITSCCPDGVPATIYLLVTDKTGELVCLADSYVFTWDHEDVFGNNEWIGGFSECPDCSNGSDVEFTCLQSLGIWQTNICFTDVTVVSESCGPPLELVWDIEDIDLNGVCTGTARFTWTSEAP